MKTKSGGGAPPGAGSPDGATRPPACLVARGSLRVPYRGVNRNHQWLSTRVAALNLRRLVTLGLGHTDTGWTLT